ncbi:MAG TPA: O-antigen ligase family protein [Candidatus Moranbacteria bacterium]|nr:O-antigen ligase family protein [Candidatus Moranbacteria bacterium]
MKLFTKIINCAVLFLLSIYLIKLPLFSGASLPLLDLLLLLAIAVNLWTLWRNNTYKPFELTVSHRLLWLGIFLILLPFILNILLKFNHSDWISSLGLLKSFFVLPILFAFSLALLLRKNYFSLQSLWWSYFLGTLLTSTIAFFYFWNNQLTFDHRLQAFYNSPNFLAFTLSTGILVGIYLINQRFFLTKTTRFLAILIILGQLFLLWQASSTGAVIGLSGTLLFWLLIHRYSRYQLFLIFSPLLISFASLIFLTNLSLFLEKIDYNPSIPPSSIDSRIAIYQSAQKIWQNNFWLGVGLGEFQTNYLENQTFFTPYPQWAVPHAHNLLLHFTVEGGFIALTGITLILFIFFTNQIKNLYLSTLILMPYLLLHGLVDMSIWKNDLAVLFWLIIFISIYSNKKPVLFTDWLNTKTKQ